MKKLVSMLLSLVILTAMLVGIGSMAFAEGDTIKIGLLANYSSIAVGYLTPGAYYAVNEINEKGGVNGKKVEIVYRDTNGDAANLIQKLTELKDEGVVAIIGPDSDSMTPATAKWAEENKVVVIAPCSFSTMVALEAHSKYFFDTGLSAWACINAFHNDIQDKGYERYVCIGTDGSASTDLINLSAKIFEEEQTTAVQVTSGSSDFSSVIMALMGANPDFTISCISATTWTSYYEQAMLMGMYDDITAYGWEFIDSLYVYSLGDDYPVGHFRGVLGWPHCVQETDEQKAMTQGFLAASKEQFGQDVTPGAQMMMWYISARSVFEALEAIGNNECTSDELVAALEKVEFSTPWHAYAKYRTMDHVLEIPYTFATVEWDDQAARTLKLSDVVSFDAEDLLPTYEEYVEYAKEQNMEMTWSME